VDFWQNDAAIAAVAAAVVALVGTAATLVLQGVMASRQRRHEATIANITRSFTDKQQRIAYRERQLNELYGPLKVYRADCTALRASFPKSPWRLVENISGTRRDAGLSTIVEAILQINRATEELLVSKAGLIDGAPPGSFSQFMHHSRLLRAAWEHGGELVPDGVEGTRVADVPYPVQFSEDVDASYERVRADLEQLRVASK
jgi:hypothetical protein